MSPRLRALRARRGRRRRRRRRVLGGARVLIFDGIGAARQGDLDGVGDSFAGVVLDETAAQSARLDAHQRIRLSVEIGRPTEDLDANRVSLEAVTAAGQRLLDDEAQKVRRSSGLLKTTTRENSFERGANF